MKKTLLKLVKRPFFQNVATVASGTAVAQAIALIFTPIITRIYSPEAFGELGVFISVTGIVSVISTLTYANAIVLPKEDKDAIGLMWLSFFIALTVSLLVTLLLIIFRSVFKSIIDINTLNPFLILIPLVIFLAGFSKIFLQWHIRKEQFKKTAKIDIAQSLARNSAKLSIGLFYPTTFSLILITVIGDAFKALLLFISAKKSTILSIRTIINWNSFNINQLKLLAKSYLDFPLYRAPQSILNMFSQSLPVLLIAGLFGAEPAGFYTMGRKILIIPSTLISQSIVNVIYPKFTEAINRGKNLSNTLKRSSLWLFYLGILPVIIIFFFGPKLFGLLLGTEWLVAGHYARWLSIMVFFMVINKPCVTAIPVIGLQGFLLVYELIAVAFRVLALFIGFIIFNDDIVAVALFSGISVLMSILLMAYVIKNSKHGRIRNDNVLNKS